MYDYDYKEYKYDQVLTIDEAMDYLRVGRTTLYNLLKNDKLKYFKVGRNYRIPKDALNDYILRTSTSHR